MHAESCCPSSLREIVVKTYFKRPHLTIQVSGCQYRSALVLWQYNTFKSWSAARDVECCLAALLLSSARGACGGLAAGSPGGRRGMREAIAATPHYMQIKNIVMSCRTVLD
jgi:hypothetical protein